MLWSQKYMMRPQRRAPVVHEQIAVQSARCIMRVASALPQPPSCLQSGHVPVLVELRRTDEATVHRYQVNVPYQGWPLKGDPLSGADTDLQVLMLSESMDTQVARLPDIPPCPMHGPSGLDSTLGSGAEPLVMSQSFVHVVHKENFSPAPCNISTCSAPAVTGKVDSLIQEHFRATLNNEQSSPLGYSNNRLPEDPKAGTASASTSTPASSPMSLSPRRPMDVTPQPGHCPQLLRLDKNDEYVAFKERRPINGFRPGTGRGPSQRTRPPELCLDRNGEYVPNQQFQRPLNGYRPGSHFMEQQPSPVRLPNGLNGLHGLNGLNGLKGQNGFKGLNGLKDLNGFRTGYNGYKTSYTDQDKVMRQRVQEYNESWPGQMLRRSEMSGPGMRRSEMSGTGMHRSEVSGPGMRRSEMSGTGMRRSEMIGTGMRRSEMSGTGMRRSEMIETGMRRSDICGPGMCRSEMSGPGMRRSEMSVPVRRRSEMSGTDMRRNEMSGTDMRRSEMSGPSMRGSEMSATGMRRKEPMERLRVLMPMEPSVPLDKPPQPSVTDVVVSSEALPQPHNYREQQNFFRWNYCTLCHTAMRTVRNSVDHYTSRAHDRRVSTYLGRLSFDRNLGMDTPVVETLALPEQVLRYLRKDRPSDLYCHLCDLRLTSKIHAEQHFFGRRHRQIERQLAEQNAPPSPIKSRWMRKDTKLLMCELCDVSITSESQMAMHTSGARHRKLAYTARARSVYGLCPAPVDGSHMYEIHNNGSLAPMRPQSVIQKPSAIKFHPWGDPSAAFYCEACHVTLNHLKSVKQHESGRMHQRNLLRLPP